MIAVVVVVFLSLLNMDISYVIVVVLLCTSTIGGKGVIVSRCLSLFLVAFCVVKVEGQTHDDVVALHDFLFNVLNTVFYSSFRRLSLVHQNSNSKVMLIFD